MKITSYYPVLATADVAGARAFYERHLGFVARYVSDWYVHLGHQDRDDVALALVAKDHATVPVRARAAAAGLLINFEVDDVDAEYERLTKAGVEVLLPLRDEPFGQRHFIFQGPDGVLVDVVKPIPPTAEFAGGYDEASLPR
jgi:catechol 2,3-dioxygenase-like lactoylglutathione lyase family enzyme